MGFLSYRLLKREHQVLAEGERRGGELVRDDESGHRFPPPPLVAGENDDTDRKPEEPGDAQERVAVALQEMRGGAEEFEKH